MFALNADLMGAFHQEVEQQMAAMTSKMDVSNQIFNDFDFGWPVKALPHAARLAWQRGWVRGAKAMQVSLCCRLWGKRGAMPCLYAEACRAATVSLAINYPT